MRPSKLISILFSGAYFPMKILVPVKRVIDANIRVRVKADNTGVETANGHAEEVIVMSAGPEKAAETIRTGLAMGADRGVHVQTDDRLEPLTIAKMIKAVSDKESCDLVVLGKQSIDDDADLRLNEPRYASLPNIMKAKKKPIDAMSPADLGVEVSNRLTVVQVNEPPAREAGVMVSSASELVEKLKNEAKVI